MWVPEQRRKLRKSKIIGHLTEQAKGGSKMEAKMSAVRCIALATFPAAKWPPTMFLSVWCGVLLHSATAEIGGEEHREGVGRRSGSRRR